MKPECRRAVNLAAGRELTDGQIDAIEAAFGRTARRLATQDRQRWQGLSRDQRTIEAGAETVKALQAEAALAKYRDTLQVLATKSSEDRIGLMQRVFGGDRAHALVRDMERGNDYIAGIKAEALGGLKNLIEAAGSKEGAASGRQALMFLFDAENPHMTRDLALEIFGKADGSTGNSLAKKGAQAWLKTIETLRQRFNAAGGDVGSLDYGYLPTLHDANRLHKAGSDAWVAKTRDLLDRERYVTEDGTRMNDVQLDDMLRAAYVTLESEGANKQTPGQFKGTGARANRGSNSRELHFKDGAAYVEYQGEFGRGSMYDAIIGHVSAMSRDIGLVERYGPNPEAQMRLQFDLLSGADGTKPGNPHSVFGVKPQGYWSVLSGMTGVPQSPLLARLGADMRNIQTFGKLGGAVISSITDLGTYFVTAGYHDLGYWNAFKNIGASMTGETKEWMTMHGIVADSMLGDLNRASGDHITNTLTGRLAQSTMKLSLMNVWTDTLRNAAQLTLMQGMARMAKKDWAALSGYDRFRMESKGITADDWAIVRQAQLETHKGLEFLTPQSLRAGSQGADATVAKVLGFIKDESEFAVVNPDLATRAIQTWGGQQAGTALGELARSSMQFKSFPIAMVSRHWRRIMEMPTNVDGRPAMAHAGSYAMAMGLSLTALGAVAFQIKQTVQGKDPIDMFGDHAAKFWLQAFVQGGGASILGDMFLKDTTEYGGNFFKAVARAALGPGIGDAVNAVGIGKDTLDKSLKGQKTHALADTIKTARSNLPYVNLWYLRAAMDHLGVHQMQEAVSPGYLGKMQQRAAKDFGQDFWYEPGELAPQRAPNIGAAIGQ